jgi:hypothetical protein
MYDADGSQCSRWHSKNRSSGHVEYISKSNVPLQLQSTANVESKLRRDVGLSEVAGARISDGLLKDGERATVEGYMHNARLAKS